MDLQRIMPTITTTAATIILKERATERATIRST